MSPTEEDDDDDAVVGRPNPVPTDSSFSLAKDDRFLISNIFLSFFSDDPSTTTIIIVNAGAARLPGNYR